MSLVNFGKLIRGVNLFSSLMKELISGQQVIPLEGNHKGIIDPMVKMKVLGVPDDTTKENEYVSNFIQDNGFK